MLPPNWAISEVNIRWAGHVAVTQKGLRTPALSFSALTAASKPARSLGMSLMPAFFMTVLA